ncbi:MAG: hypothetical protein WCY11_02440 [Novosphingobium sp.]
MTTYVFTKQSTGEVVRIDAAGVGIAIRKFAADREIALHSKYDAQGKIITKVTVTEADDGLWEMGGVHYSLRIFSKPKTIAAAPAPGSSVSNWEYNNLRESLGDDLAAQMARQMQG